ncbi:hypothetical protein L218DRAFT_947727 [Marasmius fiardii PR-910]|nr:hypothetical protein L218DRAFT_947727 [Marasmius fiardii PR-910]
MRTWAWREFVVTLALNSENKHAAAVVGVMISSQYSHVKAANVTDTWVNQRAQAVSKDGISLNHLKARDSHFSDGLAKSMQARIEKIFGHNDHGDNYNDSIKGTVRELVRCKECGGRKIKNRQSIRESSSNDLNVVHDKTIIIRVSERPKENAAMESDNNGNKIYETNEDFSTNFQLRERMGERETWGEGL